MILFWAIASVVLLIAFWIASIYFAWKIDQGKTPRKVSTSAFLGSASDKTLRLTRRGWYAAMLYGKRGYGIVEGYVRKGFLKVVPSARAAFEEREIMPADEPTSFFLREVAAAKEGIKKRLSKSKKML